MVNWSSTTTGSPPKVVLLINGEQTAEHVCESLEDALAVAAEVRSQGVWTDAGDNRWKQSVIGLVTEVQVIGE